ncbi:type IV pilus assembly protein PilQ [Thermotomaculum hydrothermale]|uniref:Type IV pilus assembly protein PilQ n=1 Tax=Thermotomaculum hydrothermale TaxID=981385 RepID=A0A7R6PFX4_9BACT|nr:type IV pilus secretin PilQ [Thermotomaculum hydrothermale]BBB31854.1 type IV pilus assembly protein PilQ [Thermotomaculum hydrothermale]
MFKRVFLLLCLISLSQVVFGFSIKGINFVENKSGTKVTVIHDSNNPLHYNIVTNNGRLFVVEIEGIGNIKTEVPVINTEEVMSFNAEPIDDVIRLTFLLKDNVKAKVLNNPRTLSFIFYPVKDKTTIKSIDVEDVLDNLTLVKFACNKKPYYTIEKDNNIVTLVLHNASLATNINDIKGVKVSQLDDDVIVKVQKDVEHLSTRVKFSNNSLLLYVGEQVQAAQETTPEQVTGNEELQYAFLTKTIAGGQKKYVGEKIGLIDIKDIDIRDLLRYIADFAGLNLIVDSSVEGTATYRFKDIPWDQALDIILKDKGLGSELQNGVLRVATLDKFRKEAEERRKLKEEKELAVDTQTIAKSLSYAKAKEVEPILKSFLSKRGQIIVDERTNTVIITDIPKKIPPILEMIDLLDRANTQVLIEARIVETKKVFAKEIGIQWGFTGIYDSSLGTQTGMSFPNTIRVGGTVNPADGTLGPIGSGYAVNLPAVNTTSSIGLMLGNVLGSFSLDMVLSAMENEGMGRILSRPHVVAQNNKTAVIESGARIPIQTVQNNTVTVKYINASLKLEVTPQITAEGTIIMDLNVKKEEPDWTHTVQGNPTIITRNANTQVLVKDGGTTVIGGIFQVNDQNSNDYVPGLRNIPLISWLFRHKLESSENNELLIFITPKIVK